MKKPILLFLLIFFNILFADGTADCFDGYQEQNCRTYKSEKNIDKKEIIIKNSSANELLELKINQIKIKEENLNQLEKEIRNLKNDYELKIKYFDTNKTELADNYKTLLENNTSVFDTFLTWLGIIIALISVVILFINFKWLEDKIETTIDKKSNNKLNELKSKMEESQTQISLFDIRINELIEKLRLIVPNEIDKILNPNQKEILNVLIKDLSKKDEKDLKSEDYFLLGLGNSNHSMQIEYFTKVIELNPHNDNAYFNIGVIQERLNRTEKAKNYYKKAIEVNSNNLKAYSNLAVMLVKEDKLDEAESLLDNAIQIDPTYVKAYMNLGNIFNLKEKYDDAITIYKKAIELNPFIGAAYSNLGLIYYNIGKNELAKENFEKAIKFNSSFPEVYFNYSLLLEREGNYEKAIETLKKVIAFNKNDRDAKEFLEKLEEKLNSSSPKPQ